MTLDHLLSEIVAVVRHGSAVDEYGNIVPGAEVRIDYPARLEQLASDEIVRDRDTVIADWRVFLPPDTDISPYDRLEGRGHIFEVSGLPDEHRLPRGPHHVEARLKFVA